MKNFFKPEDFKFDNMSNELAYVCHGIANQKLNELIESAPMAYGMKGPSEGWVFSESNICNYRATHKIPLLFIDTIRREPCNHTPFVKTFSNANDPFNAAFLLGCDVVCSKCGAKLVATWDEKK